MKSFDEIMRAAVARGPCRLVVAQAADDSVLKAAADARDRGIAEPILAGARDGIERAADAAGINLSGMTIEDTRSAADAAEAAIRMVSRGDGDVLMKGQLQTADLLHAVLDKQSGLCKGRILSHVGVFILPGSQEYRERLLLVTDAALAISPTLPQKAEITQNAIDLAHRLGITSPVAAAVCALETVNPAMPATVDAACLAKMAERGQITGGRVEGPLALDNAVSVEAARHKGIQSPLAGIADILVAPDIEAGNILYKSLIFFAGSIEAGIVVGAKVPIVVTSRSDSAQNKLYSIALASVAR